MQIAIVDYGMGNLGSIRNMFKKAGVEAVITADPAVIEEADKLILPGVGAFDSGMRNLEERGLTAVLNKRVLEDQVPVLGLCLGMQLLTGRSEEGSLTGLGWIDAETVRFRFESNGDIYRIPHMGWNQLQTCRPHPLFGGLEEANRFYFVHSYHVVVRDSSVVLGETTYCFPFVAAVASRNILGVQFHPEKSHRFGLRLLSNFAEWEYH